MTEDDIDLTDVMSASELLALRKSLELTQTEMAKRMGLSKSAYVAIESQGATLRKIHRMAAEMVAIYVAYESAQRAGNLPVHLKSMIIDINDSLS